jgi:hypothetical protein
MSDDFDFPADFDLDDADDDLDGSEKFEPDVETSVRTAVLRKNEMVALLCIKSASAGAAICRVDPRESKPALQIYDDPDRALQWLNRSLRTSRKNGWTVVYDGLPLRG